MKIFQAIICLSASILTPTWGQPGGVEVSPSINWPVPTPPTGSNSATLASPRNEWMSKFSANLNTPRGSHIDILLEGDSITEDWKNAMSVWKKYYGDVQSANFGISGDRTENLLWRIQHGEIDGLSPKLIMLLIGTNNIGRNSADEIVAGIAAIVQELKSRCPEAHILLLGVFPRGEKATDPLRAKVSEINALLEKFQGGDQVTYLDIGKTFLQPDGSITREIMPDFLHPNHAGYDLWARAIEPSVQQYLPSLKK